jgi:hypothetical protein
VELRYGRGPPLPNASLRPAKAQLVGALRALPVDLPGLAHVPGEERRRRGTLQYARKSRVPCSRTGVRWSSQAGNGSPRMGRVGCSFPSALAAGLPTTPPDLARAGSGRPALQASRPTLSLFPRGPLHSFGGLCRSSRCISPRDDRLGHVANGRCSATLLPGPFRSLVAG